MHCSFPQRYVCQDKIATAQPGMKLDIITPDPRAEFYTDERCHILELLGGADDAAISIARARVSGGVTTALHKLNGVDERYVILEGTGIVELDSTKRASVAPGDVVLIPRGTPQRITNSGTKDLVFLCVCDPPFEPTCYEALETS